MIPSKQLKPVSTAACFLTVSQRSDSSKAGFCLYLGRFSIFALFLHTAEHYFVPIVFETVFHLQGFVVFSLPISPCYDGTFSLFFPHPFFFLLFPLIVYSSCLACLVAHNPLTFPFLPDPKPLTFPASCFFPPPFSILPSLLLSSPFFYPTGLEMQIAPLFLTSVLLGD